MDSIVVEIWAEIETGELNGEGGKRGVRGTWGGTANTKGPLRVT